MNSVVSNQLIIFGWAIIFGGMLGLIYDAIRVIRRMIPHPKWIVSLEDLAFWVIASVVIFGYILKSNDGAMRGFIFIGLSLGILLYLLLLSRFIVNQTTKFLLTLCGVIKKCTLFILKPFIILLSPIYYFLKKTFKGLKKFRKWVIISLRSFAKELRFMIKKI